jgi:hypothetical protein
MSCPMDPPPTQLADACFLAQSNAEPCWSVLAVETQSSKCSHTTWPHRRQPYNDGLSDYYCWYNKFVLFSSIFSISSFILIDYVHVWSVDQRDDELANVSLIRAGYLGGSPVQPTLAMSLECLELYHQICWRKASFSVQVMVKVLCALHSVSRRCQI